MSRLAIAMDLGTSGFRAQALELASGTVLSTAITTRHPLPGANVIDHLHFALELGVATARDLMLQAVNQLLHELHLTLSNVARLAVCGNPTQISLFQGMEIRDLAFVGSRKLAKLGVKTPDRVAAIRQGKDFPGLALGDKCEVIIPPAVKDEVGADTLALILQSGISQSEETAIAIDYGTNAEMVLLHQGRMFTASAAAGPALEGQHISCGSLAVPGAIADLEPSGPNYRLWVLNSDMQPAEGALIDLRQKKERIERGQIQAKAITGTGVIAALDQALEAKMITLPHIHTADRQLHFGRDIFLTERDLSEAGKAIGAIRAGYFTLSLEAGIKPSDIRLAFLAGASGTYMDARKSGRLGLIPPCVDRVKQLGNTSLAMARQLALNPINLDKMNALADKLRRSHTLFANSKTFSRLFLLELSHWTEGMPMETYREMLGRLHLPDLPSMERTPAICRAVQRDIEDPGQQGLITLEITGRVATLQLEGCVGCLSCMKSCPTGAISIDETTLPPAISLAHAQCNGLACRRCEPSCEPKVFRLEAFFGASSREG
jgi:methylamine methyltransferase corrinoid protein reductive activase